MVFIIRLFIFHCNVFKMVGSKLSHGYKLTKLCILLILACFHYRKGTGKFVQVSLETVNSAKEPTRHIN